MITRLIKADSGRILLGQEDFTEVRGKRLRQIYQRIQMVFQSPAASFDPRRTLGDGIGEGPAKQRDFQTGGQTAGAGTFAKMRF